LTLPIQTTTLVDFAQANTDTDWSDITNFTPVNVSTPTTFSENSEMLQVFPTTPNAQINWRGNFGGFDLENKTIGMLVYRNAAGSTPVTRIELQFSDANGCADSKGVLYQTEVIREGWNYLTWYTGQTETWPVGRSFEEKNLNPIDWSDINSLSIIVRNGDDDGGIYFDRLEIYEPPHTKNHARL